ncbi:flagellar hook assembly protein FlgD [Undibacterium sp.]|jgi:flagellar basal-body rod modification protein FlgD|uniref:flagellar hook assembly protein FlgD n=1 Tax=Undibacterium sp. TaxID=1914977 RepID=UPI002CFBBC55|nr:flagellar hook assembly protein FlgD [Undibacterium sp.]HTD05379.1 flagellar hook assembly protein FlgD [Undibacterium sp.]
MSSVQSSTVDPTLLSTMNGKAAATNSTQDAQDRFLKLLVTQMQNQDPMNPMDNAQITSQLAQLSTVTGIDKLNASVVSLGTNMQSSQILQAASMINHGVLAAGSSMILAKTSSDANSASAAIYGVELPQDASSVTVTIKNAAGLAVRKIDMGALSSGVNPLSWDGKTDAGTTAADGAYTFEVAASSAGKSVSATSLGFGVISSVASGTSGIKLSVANIGEIALSDVKQVY